MRILSFLLWAFLVLIPSMYSYAQKLISETLTSKMLIQESDGFKWYKYTYEYKVKYKGNIVTFNRESAHNNADKMLVDGSFNLDWLKLDCELSYLKKKYTIFPSKIKEDYSLTLEYLPSYGLFVAKTNDSEQSLLGTFSKEGVCVTYRGQLGDNGIVYGDKEFDSYVTGGYRLTFRKEKYNGFGVIKKGNIVVPFKNYYKMETERGLYIGCRYCRDQEKNTDLYSADGIFIGGLIGEIETDLIILEFYEGPNNEKWLHLNKYGDGFHYCLSSGRKIEYSKGSLFNYRIEGDCLVFGVNGEYEKEYLYSGDGVIISDVPYDYIGYSGYNGVYFVYKDYEHGAIRVKDNNAIVLVDCGLGLFNDCSSDLTSLGLFKFSSRDEPYYCLVVNSEGKNIIPFGSYYLVRFNKKERTFSGYKNIGNDVYSIVLNLNGKEIFSRFLLTEK